MIIKIRKYFPVFNCKIIVIHIKNPLFSAQVPYLHLSTNGFCVPPCAFLRDNGDVKQGCNFIKITCYAEYYVYVFIQLLDSNSNHFGNSLPGVYKEIKRVVPPDSWIKLDCHQDHGKSTWLFLGFKTLDKNNEVLEQSWKEWTGINIFRIMPFIMSL